MIKIEYQAIPDLVRNLYVKYSAAATDLIQGEPTFHGGAWILHTDEVGPVLITKHALDFAPLVNSIPREIGNGLTNAQKLIGGPNPLTATLLGGALGAGLGYGGGYLAHKLLPGYIDEDAARKWSIMAALGGAAFPAFRDGYPNVKELGWKGLIEPSRYQGRLGNTASLKQQIQGLPTPDMQNELDRNAAYDQQQSIKQSLDVACYVFGVEPVEDAFVEKTAEFYAGAALGEIPTDQWGRAIMYDPYLDDQSKATAAGLPYAAAAATGSRWVTPVDVARVAANTILGKGVGWGIGQLAKTFLGTTPQFQEQMQNAGMLAGAVRGVLTMLG